MSFLWQGIFFSSISLKRNYFFQEFSRSIYFFDKILTVATKPLISDWATRAPKCIQTAWHWHVHSCRGGNAESCLGSTLLTHTSNVIYAGLGQVWSSTFLYLFQYRGHHYTNAMNTSLVRREIAIMYHRAMHNHACLINLQLHVGTLSINMYTFSSQWGGGWGWGRGGE